MGLTNGLFVIEAGSKGGTLDAGLECLRAGKPLYVMEYRADKDQPPGNKLLIERSGVAIRTLRELKVALSQARERAESIPAEIQLELV